MRSTSVISADLRVILATLALLYAGGFAVVRLLGGSYLSAALLALMLPYVALATVAMLSARSARNGASPLA